MQLAIYEEYISFVTIEILIYIIKQYDEINKALPHLISSPLSNFRRPSAKLTLPSKKPLNSHPLIFFW